jgi:AraC-like DNA-binding protein
MEYVGRRPSPPLDAFVERIWYCSGALPHARMRALPGGATLGLVVNLTDDKVRIYDPPNPASVHTLAGAFVSGTHTRSFVADPRQRISAVGVHFRPGGAFPFLGISPAEIVDAHVPLADLWGCAGQSLREQLLEASTPSERFRLLEEALLRRLERARPGHPAVRAAVDVFRAGDNDVRVAEVATIVGLSQRRFIEVFEREIGLTPKLYARIQRFHRVKQHIAALGKPPSWVTLALACGYFDQSHMIRDFVAFSGMSPTGYLRSRTGETMFDHFVHAYPRHHGVSRPA